MLSLTVVRVLPVGIALLGTRARRETIGFVGWFGPRGLASIVFAVIIVEEGGLPHQDVLITTAVVTVALSVLAHGLTAAPLARRYADWYDSHERSERPALESRDTTHVPWRRSLIHHPTHHG